MFRFVMGQGMGTKSECNTFWSRRRVALHWSWGVTVLPLRLAGSSCAGTADSNFFGQLGTGDTNDSVVPVPAASGRTFVALCAGGYHTCGLLESSKRVLCWGEGPVLPNLTFPARHERVVLGLIG